MFLPSLSAKRKILLAVLASTIFEAMQAKVVVSEDFSGFTSGTEQSPDIDNPVTDFDGLTNSSGWTGTSVFQAGGCAYLSLGSGLLTTPPLDLSANAGNYSVTFRAKSSTQGAVIMVMDQMASSYDYKQLTSDWQQFTMAFTNGSAGMTVNFSAMMGDFLIDDITIDDSGIGIPVALPSSDFTKDSFKANWTEALNAESYLLDVYTLDYDASTTVFTPRYIVKDKEVAGTSYTVTEGEFDEPYYYTVSAKQGDNISQESNRITVSPLQVETPTAKEATEVTADGFTAHWTQSDIATSYYLHVYKVHKAETAETYPIIDTDFSEIVTDGTIDEPQKELEWTFEGDWTSNMPVLADGIIGINNQDIDLFGQAFLQSPRLDLTSGGGKVKVSFTAFGRKGLSNAQVKLAVYDDITGISFADSKDFTISEEAAPYEFVLTGGSASSQIVITSEDDGMMFVDDLKATVDLPADSEIWLPVRTYQETGLDASVTGIIAGDSDRIGYYVRASWAVRHDEGEARQIPEVTSLPSNAIWVDMQYSGIDAINLPGSEAAVKVDGNEISIHNPSNAHVSITCLDGRTASLPVARGTQASLRMPKGMYIIQVGASAFKVAVR